MPPDATSATPDTLRAWREARRLSQRAAADLLRINPRTLEDLEYGRSPGSALWGPIGLLIPLFSDLCAPPATLQPGDDRDKPCGQALDPHLDDLARRAEAAGWHRAEITAAVLDWALHAAIEGAGAEAARQILDDAREVIALF